MLSKSGANGSIRPKSNELTDFSYSLCGLFVELDNSGNYNHNNNNTGEIAVRCRS